jgi:hypothetical protein
LDQGEVEAVDVELEDHGLPARHEEQQTTPCGCGTCRNRCGGAGRWHLPTP